MDRRERSNTHEETLRMAFESMQAGLWTAMPGIIQSFNSAAMTCVVQPTIQGVVRNKDGSISKKTLPLLLDCPVMFPSGGGVTTTFPIVKGNECLVFFASRCIDAWWQQGNVQPPMELRMHDLSDGFVFCGVFSQPNVIANISATEAQMRTNTGLSFVGITPGTEEVRLHGGTVYSWDCHGYGQTITWTGGKNYTINTYGSDANITNNTFPLSQPGPL